MHQHHHPAVVPAARSSSVVSVASVSACIGALCLIAVAFAARADDVVRGLEAYQRGDYIQALNIWVPLAKGGDPVAQFGLGTLYQKGNGVEPNQDKATAWFRRAAKQGFVPAQFNLGNAYRHGRGVERDDTRAVYWWGKAAEQAFAPAQFNLGTAYLYGRGVEPDRAAAVRWYRRAADNGHGDAARALTRLAQSDGTTSPAPAEAGAGPTPSEGRAQDGTPAPAAAPPKGRGGVYGTERGIEWVLGQDPARYTLQLLAARHERNARAFARAHLDGAPHAIFPYSNAQGTRWYAVLYGAFPTRAAARRALQDLPQPLREGGAWVRSFGGLQSAVAK